MPERGFYGRLARRRLLFLAGAFCFVLASATMDILTGPAGLSLSEVVAAVFQPGQSEATLRTIVWTFRIPTAAFALLIGCALGVAGAEMQTILGNPLASPFTLGVSAAAGFGAALAMVCGVAVAPGVAAFIVPANAFVFATLCSLVVYGIAKIKRGSSETIILCGIALLFLFNSGVAFLEYIASEDELQAVVFWMFGSLQGATWPKLAVVASVLAIAIPIIASQAWKLTALRLGDVQAQNLGIDVERLRLRILILVSMLTAVAVCFAGTIGFIGLVGPHLARILVGEDQRYFLPLSGLIGALLLSLASIASKMLFPGAIFPVGIATSLIGVPFFTAMIIGRKRNSW
ncbi:MAG TPA: iron ABC transporter permease [Candidatus Brocadiia bacterium]|nr:iron ABC transporter permease [Candidatus Brocadiia bacterium]